MSFGLPKIPKLSDTKRSESPFESKAEAVVDDHNSNETHQTYKREQEISINDEQVDVKEEPTESVKVRRQQTNKIEMHFFL